MIQKVNLSEKFASFHEHWSPKIVGEVGDAAVKLVKLGGEFVWHQHEAEDELFLVVKGELIIKVRTQEGEQDITLCPGEFVVIPKGTEHLPVAREEAHVLLFEPKTTLNTGNVRNERTVEALERV